MAGFGDARSCNRIAEILTAKCVIDATIFLDRCGAHVAFVSLRRLNAMDLLCLLCEANGKPVFVAGSGLSAGLVPMPWQLLERLIADRVKIEAGLGCAPTIALTSADVQGLYGWAEEAVALLIAKGHAHPKLAVATALGVTTDPAWQGKVNIPLRGSAPRHRVIARFAREGRWSAMWSLNWDCVLETAFECVGMPVKPAMAITSTLPWREWHVSWTYPEATPASTDDTVVLVKPHGCVRKLIGGAAETFLITKQELSTVQLNPVKSYIKKHFSGEPLIACGWSASEKYIVDLLEELKNEGSLGIPDPNSTLHFIDPKTPDGHKKLISLYGANPSSSSTIVESAGAPSTDEFFLWLQTLFGLHRLVEVCPSKKTELLKISAALSSAKPGLWVNDFFDSFISGWSLLCFRLGFTNFYLKASPILEHAIPPDREDEHIPLSHQSVPRSDLVSACGLLAKLWSKGAGYDFTTFPGAIWDAATLTATIPVPNWTAIRPTNLTAFGEMMRRHRWQPKGRIETVRLLALNTGPAILDLATNAAFRRAVAREATSLGWADESMIHTLLLDDL
jgi:hypothetical protein